MRITRRQPLLFPGLVLLLAFALTGSLTGCSTREAGEHISIEVLSSRPYLVSGDSALIEVRHDGAQEPQLLLNGRASADTVQLHGTDGEQRSYRVLLTQLQQGENVLEVVAGEARASLTLVNYPITGPMISGPHQEPYLCLDAQTPGRGGAPRTFSIGNGDALDSMPLDNDCSLPTRVDYLYSSDDSSGFQALTDTSSYPEDLQYTVTSDGSSVPYIIRLETGTINRAIYQIAILHDPLQPAPSAHQPSASWNERLVYTYGGGCEAGYFQGTSTGGVLRDNMLAKGYAVASSTLNVNAQGGCNDVLSAETTMMVKEHFIKHYGPPLHTIGNGGSGGAMQQLLIAGAYPGLLDGLLVSMTFSDAVSYFSDSQECSQPLRRFVNDSERGLSDETKAILGAWPTWSLCDRSLGGRPDRISPFGCSAQIPVALRYDPENNPAGIRCSIYDGMRNIFGETIFSDINTERAFARSPHDNVGVQYGLLALNEGLIDTQLFLDLNEAFGGWDIDFNHQPQRVQGDPEAIRIAYETGRITNGKTGLSQVPIIDDRVYLDHQGNFHASVYSFTTRARLERDNGHAENYVIRRHDSGVSLTDENLALMDEWLSRLHADQAVQSDQTKLERIVAARPPQLQDDCFTGDGERIIEPAVYNTERMFDNTEGRCNSLYPPHGGLRLVAGGPLSNDVLKCQLKPIDFADYTVNFTDEEKQRLMQIFPEGVCDWSKPGMYQDSNETWLSFGPSPVNRYAQ